jgi:hypothetical protein
MKSVWLNTVDEVWDTGDVLIIRNKQLEEHVPLSEIMNVSYNHSSLILRLTLLLRNPTKFGTRVTFFVQPMGLRGFTNPIIDSLIKRIDAARRTDDSFV